jgi:hypothetical protein
MQVKHVIILKKYQFIKEHDYMDKNKKIDNKLNTIKREEMKMKEEKKLRGREKNIIYIKN